MYIDKCFVASIKIDGLVQNYCNYLILFTIVLHQALEMHFSDHNTFMLFYIILTNLFAYVLCY